jgi:hypothetical protein
MLTKIGDSWIDAAKTVAVVPWSSSMRNRSFIRQEHSTLDVIVDISADEAAEEINKAIEKGAKCSE